MRWTLTLLKAKLRGALAQLPHIPGALALVWTAARGWTLAWALLLIVQGLLPVATAYLTRSLVDRLVAALGSGGAWEPLRSTLLLVGLLAGIMLLLEFLRSISALVRTAQAHRLQEHVMSLIHGKSAAADL